MPRSKPPNLDSVVRKGMSPNVIVPERVLESDIERARKEQQVKEAVPVGRVVDFTMLQEVSDQLGMK